MKNSAFVTRNFLRISLLSLSLCAASAMAADAVDGYGTTTSTFSNVGEHGAAHHVVVNSGLGEAFSIAKNIASDATSWQTTAPVQNSVLFSSPASAATASLPSSLTANARLSSSTIASIGASGEKTGLRASDKLREFDTSALSRPGIYTMILIGIGLLSLRSRRKLGQDEKFAM